MSFSKVSEDFTANSKTRFVQFLDSILVMTGNDTRRSYDGTTFITTGGVFDLANCPQGKFVVNYKDRIHIIGSDGILYSSSVPRFHLDYDGQTVNFNVGARVTGGTSGATAIIYKDTDAGATGTLQLTGIIGTFQNNEAITDSSGGAAVVNGTGSYKISWTDGYITTPIDPDNGEKGECTGLGVIGGLMFIFFERAFYTWNGSATNPDPIADIGCSSQESVATCDGYMFFANKDGVYMSQGGFPQRISRFLQDFFDNMNAANYANIAGGCDGKHYYCSLGSVTIDGETIPNVVLRYSIKSQEWAVYSLPTQPMVFSQYIDGTTIKLVYGDNDGNVIQIDSTATDDTYASTTVAIDYELRTNEMFTPLQGALKTIYDRIYVQSENSSGAKFYYKTDKNTNRQEDWKYLKEIKENNQNIAVSSLQYKTIMFKLAGVSTKGRFRLKAIEIPKVNYNSF